MNKNIMNTKQQLKQMAERVDQAFSVFNYDYVIVTDALTCRIEMRFSRGTDVISSVAVENFRSVVGAVGVELWENQLVLFGYPLLF